MTAKSSSSHGHSELLVTALTVTPQGRTLANRAIIAVEACDDEFFALLGKDTRAFTRALATLGTRSDNG